MEQISLGLIDGVDVRIFAKPEFDDKQMEQIRIGLVGEIVKYKPVLDVFPPEYEIIEVNIDVNFYAKPEFNRNKMRDIRLELDRKNNQEYYDIFEKMEKISLRLLSDKTTNDGTTIEAGDIINPFKD